MYSIYVLAAAVIFAAVAAAVIFLPRRLMKSSFFGETVFAIILPNGGRETIERTLRTVSKLHHVSGMDMIVMIPTDNMSKEGVQIADIIARGCDYMTVCSGIQTLQTLEEQLCSKRPMQKSNISSLKDA